MSAGDAAAPGGPGASRTTVGAALIALLAEHGVDKVFGIPGVHTLELFRGIAGAGLRHVPSRHEQGAVFAADGYARVTGRPGVVLLIPGPGVTNAATGLAQAYHDSIPLLVIACTPPPARLGGQLHGLPDQAALLAGVTGWSHSVTDADKLPAAVSRAFALLASERPRPVSIGVPAALLGRPAPDWRPIAPATSRPRPEPRRIARAAGILAAAKRPMVLLGGGAVDAAAEAVALAERLDAPVALTLNAKGTVPDDHPLSVGTSLPARATMDALREADAVLAIGTELCDVDFYYAAEPLRLDGALIRIDIDPDQLDAGIPAAVGIHSDARAALAVLADALGGRVAAGGGAARAAEIRRDTTWWERARPLLPLVEEIGRALPRDAVVVADSTQLAYIGQNAWPAWRRRSWLIPSGWGTLGPALPMAIGAAVGAPGRPVIAVAGDGGLLYTIGEMSAAAELGLPLVLLLWNNAGYGEMRDEMNALGIPHIGTSATAHDYLAIARGFGWSAERAGHGDVGAAIARAVSRGTPSLVELSP